MTHLLIW